MTQVLSNFITLIFLSSFFYGGYHFMMKLISGEMNQIAGAFILQFSAAIITGLLLICMKWTGAEIEMSSKGISYAVIAGFMVGLAEICAFTAYSKGVPVSVGVPIIVGVSVLIGTMMGISILKESFHVQHFAGLVLIVTGALLLTLKLKS